MKILCLHANTGSRFYRAIPQLNWMQKHGHEVRLEVHNTPHYDQLLEWCDVLVLQLVFSKEMVVEARKLGKKVIFECDDLIHKTHAKHYAYAETDTLWKRIKMLWNIWGVLRNCNGLIVSNNDLKKMYGWMCPRTLVFPNYMSIEHWLKEPKKNPSDRVRVLWAGSTSHTGDLEWVKPIIGTILAKYPQVQFIYIGHGGVPTDDLYAKFVYGDDIFDGLPREQRESLLAAPANMWPYILSSLQADIAIAPLEKNDFNKYKTQCKYYEYGLNGIPGVYSKWFYTEVISPSITHIKHILNIKRSSKLGYPWKGCTGLQADTPEEWIAALSLLIENVTLRRTIGENARKEILENYNFSDHAPAWQGFVESL